MEGKEECTGLGAGISSLLPGPSRHSYRAHPFSTFERGRSAGRYSFGFWRDVPQETAAEREGRCVTPTRCQSRRSCDVEPVCPVTVEFGSNAHPRTHTHCRYAIITGNVAIPQRHSNTTRFHRTSTEALPSDTSCSPTGYSLEVRV